MSMQLTSSLTWFEGRWYAEKKEVIQMAETAVTNEKMMGALAYLLGPVTGILLLLTEKKNAFVRFHAMQSTLVFGGIILLYVVLAIIPIIGWLVLVVISSILPLASFILWLVLMWKAYTGDKFKLPYFGDLAEKQLAKLK